MSGRRCAAWVLCLVAGCSGGRADAAEQPRVGPSQKGLQGVNVYRARDGAAVSLGELGLRRQPVLFSLWATWCAPCVKELPRLEQLHQQFRHAVRFVGVAQDLNSVENRRAVRELVEAAGLSYPQFLEADGETLAARMLGKDSTALPAFVLYGTGGERLFSLVGSLEVSKNQEALLGELRRVAEAADRPNGKKEPAR